MKNPEEIRAQIALLHKHYDHVLHGECSTILINAPRALLQLEAESHLKALHWVLGETFKSALKGVDAGGRHG